MSGVKLILGDFLTKEMNRQEKQSDLICRQGW